ncbi:hypothetical protein BSKO_03273 [Bryopsis sp. KO-2023]|nr:hypothetical protein BSKO_03273 [Bryopsis sp. KO-2023]
MPLTARSCYVSSRDTVAKDSARTPRPNPKRFPSATGLRVRTVRYHPSRLNRCLAAESSNSREVLTKDQSEVEVSKDDSENGNGRAEEVGQEEKDLGNWENWRSGTVSVHGGERGGRPRVSDSLTTPIVQTSTYRFVDTNELIAYQEGRYGSYEYGRYGNPTTRTCEEKIKALEGAEDCLLSASGMNSATTLLLALVPAGGHIVTTTDCYRRTRQFIQTVLPKMGISATVIDPSDIGALKKILDEREVSLFFTESPTNPYLRCVDVPEIARLCHENDAVVVIDSTFATPCNQKALDLGADIVIHSATKYLAGHNDVLAGVVCGKMDLVSSVRSLHNVLGGVVDPHAAYLLLRGMKTVSLRVKQHNESAMELSKRLEAHPEVEQVWYPGLPSHPDHEIAEKFMSGFGGVVSFSIKGDLWRTAKFIDGVKLPYIAPSLGGVESLIEQPAVVSYWDIGAEARAELGIKENLVRFSCGVEDLEDIWADMEQSLDKL